MLKYANATVMSLLRLVTGQSKADLRFYISPIQREFEMCLTIWTSELFLNKVEGWPDTYAPRARHHFDNRLSSSIIFNTFGGKSGFLTLVSATES
jgi:hypothetical protein